MSALVFRSRPDNVNRPTGARYDDATTVAAVELRGICLGSGKRVRVLDDVSLTVAAGETVAVVGSNGSGKTSLLRVVTGAYRPMSGSRSVRAPLASVIDVTLGAQLDLRARATLRIEAGLLGLTGRHRTEVCERAIELSDLGVDMFDEPMRGWSAGMQLRLHASLAFALRPAVLVVDEVLATADAAFLGVVEDQLRQLAAAGTAILMASHDAALVGRQADRVVHVAGGRIVQAAETSWT